jgi:predicted small lipoprotein YifL
MNHDFPLTLIALILTISLVFTGCGQKGDLVRPQPKQQTPAEKPHLSPRNSN